MLLFYWWVRNIECFFTVQLPQRAPLAVAISVASIVKIYPQIASAVLVGAVPWQHAVDTPENIGTCVICRKCNIIRYLQYLRIWWYFVVYNYLPPIRIKSLLQLAALTALSVGASSPTLNDVHAASSNVIDPEVPHVWSGQTYVKNCFHKSAINRELKLWNTYLKVLNCNKFYGPRYRLS